MKPAGRLNSWKEIAAYLGVSARTAQRWEKLESLPAQRHKHEVLSSVFAYRSELDAWWHSRPDLQAVSQEVPAPARSIAVLPFINLNRDEENEILSDGITEELINALSQVQGLQVVARTSAFHFKGKTDDIRTVGTRLGVQTILEGSLRRSGDRLRVTAQLINVADGYHLWSERFDHRMTDLFDLQEEIADAIVNGPSGEAGRGQDHRAERSGPRSLRDVPGRPLPLQPENWRRVSEGGGMLRADPRQRRPHGPGVGGPGRLPRLPGATSPVFRSTKRCRERRRRR